MVVSVIVSIMYSRVIGMLSIIGIFWLCVSFSSSMFSVVVLSNLIVLI